MRIKISKSRISFLTSGIIEELRQMEEAASAQRREIENNPRQNDTNLISTDIYLDKVRKKL
jgi:hypothetical protein